MTTSALDRVALAESARQVLQQESNGERRRAAIAAGASDDRLDTVLTEVGWPSILVPEQFGGFGGALGDVESLLVEVGRWAAVGTFGPSGVVATSLLQFATAGVQEQLFPGLADGSLRATFALVSAGGSMPPHGDRIRARRDGDDWVLHGASAFVPAATSADAVVVLADHDGIWRAFVVLAAELTAAAAQETWDLTRQFGTVTLRETRLGADRELVESGDVLLDRMVELAAYWLACDSLGLAQRLVQDTAAYGAERVQFGRPIGSFQAWKHYAVNMHIAAEAARAAVGRATAAFDRGETGAAAASVAKLIAADAAESVACWATQLHGGIAYTWEHDTHLFLKRAKLNQLLVGDGDHHRDRIARTLA